MNCIDAIEGTAKTLLGRFLEIAAEERMDVSDYIRNVKAIIDTVTQFVKNNPEVSRNPDLISSVLYDYAKTIWLKRLGKNMDPEQDPAWKSDMEYQAYCYDYVYTHGNYPR